METETKKKKHKLKKKSVSIDLGTDFFVLGFDLSLTSPGYAIINYKNGTIEIIDMGRVNNKNPKLSRGERLSNIQNLINEKINTVKENKFVCVRENSFSRFAAETQAIAAVNGVFDLCLYNNKVDEAILLSPLTVKKLVTGCAKATKQDVAEAINNYCTHKDFETDDVSDAVAVAIACLIENKLINQIPLEKYKEKNDGI